VQRFWRTIGVLSVLLGCCLPVLTFARTPAAAGKPTSHSAASGSSRTLRLAMPDTAPTVDPALVADDENAELAHLLYSGLVRLDSSYRIVPDAAARIAVARDHRTYTFYLRKDLRFSNGDPVTAYDFEFSIKRSLNPALKSPSAPWYLIDIDGASAVLAGKTKKLSGVKVLNPYTLQISARWPVPYFLMELTYPTSYALDKKRIAKFGTGDASWFSNPIGSGPFVVARYDPGSVLELVRNPRWWGAKRPALRRITYRIIPNENSLLVALRTHEIDWFSAATPRMYPQLTAIPGFTVRLVPTNASDATCTSVATPAIAAAMSAIVPPIAKGLPSAPSVPAAARACAPTATPLLTT